MYRFKHTLYMGLVYSIVALGVGLSLQATEPKIEQGDWASLSKLAAGEKVLVALNGAQSYQGQFKTLTDESIEVHLAAGDRTFQRKTVFRVSTRGASHRARNALSGALVGAGAGLGIGAAADRSPKCGSSGPFLCGQWFPNLNKEIFTPVGAIVGGVVGAVLLTGGWRVIYRAR